MPAFTVLLTAPVISRLKCSWNWRVVVTASSACIVLWMIFADITKVTATDARTRLATNAATITSTKVKAEMREAPWRIFLMEVFIERSGQ